MVLPHPFWAKVCPLWISATSLPVRSAVWPILVCPILGDVDEVPRTTADQARSKTNG